MWWIKEEKETDFVQLEIDYQLPSDYLPEPQKVESENRGVVSIPLLEE